VTRRILDTAIEEEPAEIHSDARRFVAFRFPAERDVFQRDPAQRRVLQGVAPQAVLAGMPGPLLQDSNFWTSAWSMLPSGAGGEPSGRSKHLQ
jgi:hypothetical protein